MDRDGVDRSEVSPAVVPVSPVVGPKVLKPLVVCFACEPKRGSEYGTGWHFIEELSRAMPVHVLAHEYHRQSIEEYMPRHPYHPIHFKYVNLPLLRKTIWGPEMGINLYYFLWHYKAQKVLKAWHAEEHFDIAHHITFTRHWMGSVASRLGIPFIWGPVGGGREIPKGFQSTLSFKHRFVENARTLTRKMWHFDPMLRSSVKNADIGLATARDTGELMAELGVRNLDVMSATALPAGQFESLRDVEPLSKQDGLFRFIFVGRVSHWKGLELAVEAFANLKDVPHARLRIVGDGPTFSSLKQLIKTLGVEDRVELPGYFEHAQNIEQMAQCEVLLHPALRDSAGCAAEAIRIGKPILCFDIGTPAILMDEHSGLRVPLTDPKSAVKGMEQAMRTLATNPALYERLRLGALSRDTFVSREARGKRLLDLYRKLASMHNLNVLVPDPVEALPAVQGDAPLSKNLIKATTASDPGPSSAANLVSAARLNA
jgi:glycosyltransferase involved in cell wall biosynthesis